jgi:hypothetical protein
MLSTPHSIERLILGRIGKYEEDGTECSETSARKLQTPGNHPKKDYKVTVVSYIWFRSHICLEGLEDI